MDSRHLVHALSSRARLLRAHFVSKLAFIVGISIFSLLSGCRANCDLVEAELRSKEIELDECRADLKKKDCDIESLEAELETLQRRTAKPRADGGGATIVVKSITLGRLTGGYDKEPDCPGDEELQVVVEPRDCDEQSIKAPGSLVVEAFEINGQGLKAPLSKWEVPSRQLRRTWESSLFGSSAYHVRLPWKTWPSTERLRVVARFTTPVGQSFEADRDVSIRLPERPKQKEKPEQEVVEEHVEELDAKPNSVPATEGSVAPKVPTGPAATPAAPAPPAADVLKPPAAVDSTSFRALPATSSSRGIGLMPPAGARTLHNGP